MESYLIRHFDGRTNDADRNYLIHSTGLTRTQTRNLAKGERALRSKAQRELDAAKRDNAIWAGERTAMVFGARGYGRKDCTDAEIKRLAKAYLVDVNNSTLFGIVKGTVLANLYKAQRHFATYYPPVKAIAFSAMTREEYDRL